jgi:hypothetical protein
MNKCRRNLPVTTKTLLKSIGMGIFFTITNKKLKILNKAALLN